MPTDLGDRCLNLSQSINKSSSKSKSRSSSQHRQSSRDTTRFSGTSSVMDTSGSSRVLHISSDSFADDHERSSSWQSHHNSSRELREKTRAEMHAHGHQRHQHSRSEPPESLPKETYSRPSSKSSYYFGEAPDLEEILASLNGSEGALEGVYATTPMNDPIPSDIKHQTDCYLFHPGAPPNVYKKDGPSPGPHVDEVVRIKVPFSEPYEPLEPLLTARHNMERLAAQQISPLYNGHKVTIQVNRGNQDEGRLIQENPMLSPTDRSSFNFNVRRVGTQQVTKQHITTTEKKVCAIFMKNLATQNHLLLRFPPLVHIITLPTECMSLNTVSKSLQKEELPSPHFKICRYVI